ncbi:MAG TPA: hypothetical protein VN380_24145 [Thermoanaerobaculia bacterium]|jgi:hypothetical protein|nr:hypothetical protein [Thermoanaerobaculia bacterium]
MPLDKKSFYARTMHTPDSPERAVQRESLREVSKLLLPLHRALIDAAKEDYALAVAPVKPAQLLQLLTDDPFFEWLKPVTSLIVDIDEMARTDFEAADVAAIAGRLDRLFGPKAEGMFAAQYIPMLQRSVDIAIGHAALRKAVSRLRG